MNRSYSFAQLLAESLRDPEIDAVRHRYYSIQAKLDTGPVVASIEIQISWLFREVKRMPPKVFCHESWMKKGAEWHNAPPMCWILPEEWRGAMSWQGKPVNDILHEGRAWLLNNVCCLVNRHYLAHLEGITKWPEEWSYWEHFEAGVRQYAREQRRREWCNW